MINLRATDRNGNPSRQAKIGVKSRIGYYMISNHITASMRQAKTKTFERISVTVRFVTIQANIRYLIS
ncbi:hypothetical protein [Leptospira sp. 'Mane']|uniref:hypothetical protein n=1 Tax=Leptospira sp. 'Mane' TaxID=3387407 RepID=UPI00398B9293